MFLRHNFWVSLLKTAHKSVHGHTIIACGGNFTTRHLHYTLLEKEVNYQGWGGKEGRVTKLVSKMSSYNQWLIIFEWQFPKKKQKNKKNNAALVTLAKRDGKGRTFSRNLLCKNYITVKLPSLNVMQFSAHLVEHFSLEIKCSKV